MRLSPALPLLLAATTACAVDQDFGTPKSGAPAAPAAPAPQQELGPEIAISRPLDEADRVQAAGGAFDGQIYLFVWRGLRGMSAARLDASGKVLDATPMVLAPPADAGDGTVDPPHVFARPDGGFRVFWTDQADVVDDATDGLHGVFVERDGSFTRVVAWNRRSSLVNPFDLVGHVHSVAPLDEKGTFRVLVESDGDTVFVKDTSFPTPEQWGALTAACAARVTLPGLVAGTATFARAGARNLIGGLVADQGTVAITLGEIAAPPSLDACEASGVGYADVSYLELVRAPLPRVPPTVARPLELIAVDDGAVAVWVNHDAELGKDGPIELLATHFPTSGAPSSPVELASGVAGSPTFLSPPPSPGLGLGLAAHGDEVLVPLLFMGAPDTGGDSPRPVALRLDPRTMTTAPVGAHGAPVPGELGVYSPIGSPSFSIAGPAHDYLFTDGGGAGTFVDPQPGSMARLDRISADAAVRLSWPGAPFDAVPGGLSAVSHSEVACAGDACALLWLEDPTSIPPAWRASWLAPGSTTPAPFNFTMPHSAWSSSGIVGNWTAPPKLVAGAGGALAAQVVGDSNTCRLQIRPISKDGVGPAQETPLACAQFDIAADGASFLAVAFAPNGLSILRLAADGSLLARKDVPSDLVPRLPTEEDRNALAATDPTAIFTDWGLGGRIRLVPLKDRVLALAWTADVPSPQAFAFSMQSGGLDPSPNIPLPPDASPSAEVTSAGDHAGLVWLAAPDPTHASFVIRALDLDALGHVIVPARDLAQGDGIASSLRAAPDDGGMAVTYAVQSFDAEPARLALRRFDKDGHAVGDVQELARDLPVAERFDAAIASTGPGAWFVAYARPTLAADDSTTLFGRCVTGGPKSAGAVK